MYAAMLGGAKNLIKELELAGVGQGLQRTGHTCNINQCRAESSDLEQRAQIWSRELQNAHLPELPAGPATVRERRCTGPGSRTVVHLHGPLGTVVHQL